MLPRPYELPGALLLVLGGALACFAGHRLFRIVLGLYGFVFGALLASSIMGITNSLGMIGAALAGGIGGSLLLVFAWFVGVALVGAGVGVFVAHLVWNQRYAGDPAVLLVVGMAVLGAAVAMAFQRIVVIVGTAFAGAWTMVVGAVTLLALRAGMAPTSDVWIVYPLAPAGERRWVPIVWIALGLAGTIVQLGGHKRSRTKKR